MVSVRRCRAAGLAGAAAATLSIVVGSLAPAFAQARHDKAFWQGVVANKYAPPPGEPLAPLVRELSGLLGSPDPELRDDIGYSVLASWIYRQRIVPLEQRRALIAEWTNNLHVGIGSRGNDEVLRRSFSALALGILVILDNEAPYLDEPEFRGLLQSALTYLAAEHDVRGFDARKGWIHSVAHTADLLKFLARSRHLRPADQAAILTGITDKLSTVDTALVNGEDERLARAVLSIAAREDFDESGFRGWVRALVAERGAGAPTPIDLARDQNRRHLLVSLFAVLSTDTRNLASVAAARAVVLEAMKTVM